MEEVYDCEIYDREKLLLSYERVCLVCITFVSISVGSQSFAWLV